MWFMLQGWLIVFSDYSTDPLFEMPLFQIIFNPTSAKELSSLPKDLQLYVLGEFRGLPRDIIGTEMEQFGKLQRGSKTLHRFRLGDYRVYFEKHELGVVVHRIFNKNTIKDFLYRSNLPLGEDEALEKSPRFWEMIENAKQAENVTDDPPVMTSTTDGKQ